MKLSKVITLMFLSVGMLESQTVFCTEVGNYWYVDKIDVQRGAWGGDTATTRVMMLCKDGGKDVSLLIHSLLSHLLLTQMSC
jgi:hypothetical protein